MRSADASPSRPPRARELLAGAGLERLDAEVLLAHVLGCPRAALWLDDPSVSSAQAARFAGLVDRRRQGEPVAYLVGRRAFRSLELSVDPRVLIPRPETEHLVEAALGLPAGRVVDVGTGSGAVALALKDERPDLEVVGVDVSADALAVARANGEALGLAVEWVEGDLLDGVAGPLDAVVANLPYVGEGETIGDGVRWEPPLAVRGGPDGLDVIRRLIAHAAERRFRRPEADEADARAGREAAAAAARAGWEVGAAAAFPFLALEVGATQATEVAALCRGAGYRHAETHRDLAGIERVVVARR